MKSVTINQNQKGLFYRNGRLERILDAGKYYLFGGRTVETSEVSREVIPEGCTAAQLMALPEAQKELYRFVVPDGHRGLLYNDGRFLCCLAAGEYLYWRSFGELSCEIMECTDEELSASIPEAVLRKIEDSQLTRIEVPEHNVAVLYHNGKKHSVLESGNYCYWRGLGEYTCENASLLVQMMDMNGQDILTRDKVSVRINMSLTYRITDAVKMLESFSDWKAMLYNEAKLALRRYITKYKMDEILENREEISDILLRELNEKAGEMYIEIQSVGIKDIILPGEISQIMNSVLAAEKRAQANVIMRREEVASTRSLLNTAKLMDENATLRKLKELEYLERICENVGAITVDGSRDLLSQLTGVVTGRAG